MRNHPQKNKRVRNQVATHESNKTVVALNTIKFHFRSLLRAATVMSMTVDFKTSFIRSMCIGEIEEEVLFPFPKLKDSEKEILRSIQDSIATNFEPIAGSATAIAKEGIAIIADLIGLSVEEWIDEAIAAGLDGAVGATAS